MIFLVKRRRGGGRVLVSNNSTDWEFWSVDDLVKRRRLGDSDVDWLLLVEPQGPLGGVELVSPIARHEPIVSALFVASTINIIDSFHFNLLLAPKRDFCTLYSLIICFVSRYTELNGATHRGDRG